MRTTESKHPENANRAHAAKGVLPGARVLSSPAVRDGSIYKFWVYVLSSNSGTLYIGVTGYLARRVHQHKIDSIEGFTEKYQIHRLVYYEAFDHIVKAISREKQLKGWRRQKKMALVETTNPRWRDLAEQWAAKCGYRDNLWGELPESAFFARWHFRDVSTASSHSLRLRST